MNSFRLYSAIVCIFLIQLPGVSLNGKAVASDQASSSYHLLSGVFIQLNSFNSEWPEEKWDDAFRSMKRLGFEQIIVQWCRQNEIRYYGDRDGAGRAEYGFVEKATSEIGGGTGVLETILYMCEKYNFSYYLGLYDDAAFWAEIKAPNDAVEHYLYALTAENLNVARELLPFITGRAGFLGYYIPQEIDDITWNEKEKTRLLKLFINGLGPRLRAISPNADILISTFFRGRISSSYFAERWCTLLEEKPIDGLLVQDGIGSGEVTLEDLKNQLSDLSDALRGSGVALWSVVEAFTSMAAAEGEFKAVSADVARIEAQLSAADLAEKEIAFSMKYFLPSPDVDGSEELFVDYERLVSSR